MNKILVILLISTLSSFGNDTLNVKVSFTFNSNPSKFFQEPKFLEIEIRNDSYKDFYFAKPAMGIIINEIDTLALVTLKGIAEHVKDIEQQTVQIQEESYAFRETIRNNIKAKGLDINSVSDLAFFAKEHDAFFSTNPLYQFIRKGATIKFKFFISNKLKPGDYKLFFRAQEYPEAYYQFFPEDFQGYKFFKGVFYFKDVFEFKVE